MMLQDINECTELQKKNKEELYLIEIIISIQSSIEFSR